MIEQNSLFFAANLGTEVLRMEDAVEKNDLELLSRAYDRAMKILERLRTFTDMKPRAQELANLELALQDLKDKRAERVSECLTPFMDRIALKLHV